MDPNTINTPVDIEAIVNAHYTPGSRLFRVFWEHGEQVAQKALAVAAKVAHLNRLELDLDFIREAAMLHDIGMVMTDVPSLGCMGVHPYICHGLMGRVMLENIGLPRHAMVCERHVGVGITERDIIQFGMPLPVRDMSPQSMEEQIICYADTFFSKDGDDAGKEKSVDEVVDILTRYGADKVKRFREWVELFGG